MPEAPIAINRVELERVVETAVGCITQGADDHFRLRAISRAEFRDGDPLMVALAKGATWGC